MSPADPAEEGETIGRGPVEHEHVHRPHQTRRRINRRINRRIDRLVVDRALVLDCR